MINVYLQIMVNCKNCCELFMRWTKYSAITRNIATIEILEWQRESFIA